MTSHIQSNRWLLTGLLALAAITAVVALVVLGDGDDPQKPAPSAPPQAARVQLEAWPVDRAQTVRVIVDRHKGPVWMRGDETVALTPHPEDSRFESWSVETLDDRTQVVGKGTMGQAQLSATWTLVDGNPQAHLALAIDGITADRLTSAIALTRPQLPSQEEEEEDAERDRLVLWQPVAGLECTQSDEGDEGDEATRFDLRTQQIVSLQRAPSVSSWRYSGGASAQLIPVFDLPGSHSDPQVAQTAAKSASAWLRRAHTLIYGHSNPDDPRYGNGGLLGHGLGATIAVPPAWADHPKVLELARDLEGSRVELAARDADAGADLHSTRFAIEPSCQTLVELGQEGVPAAVVGTATSENKLSQIGQPRGLSTAAAPLVATAAPVEFDGQLSTLLGRGFDTRALDQVVRERGRVVFSSPFVATRNPLIGAAKEGLLQPERDGQWTVAAELSEALANLELWREATPLSVTSVGAAASQASAAKQVLHWWGADGTLRVFNSGEKVIRGYTLIVAGSTGATLEEVALSSRQILLDDKRQATLVWWDLEPGVHSLELSADDDQGASLTPVVWHVSEQ